MAVRGIFGHGDLGVGGSDFNSGSMYVGQPWEPASAVWLQCTTRYVAGEGQSEFGIQTIYQLDPAGNFQVLNFGDDHFGTYLAVQFVSRFLGVVVAARTYNAAIAGTLTLFSWG